MKARDLLSADSRVTEQIQDERSRYEQAARDVVKGADPDHIARVRQLDPELLRKYVGYAWNRVNSGEYKLNRPNLEEDLRKWFKEKWVRFGPDGKIRGDCARGDDSEGKPKCLPQSKAHSLGKKGRASAAARKRREDPNPQRKGKAINVATKKKTNEASQVNLSTAQSLGRDLHDAVLELNELVKSGKKVVELVQLRREILDLYQQLQSLGYDYDPRTSGHIAPLTIDNQPTGKIQEEQSQPMHVNDYLKQAEDLHNRMLYASKAGNVNEFEQLKKERAELDIRARQGLVAEQQCPNCGGPAFANLILAEKQDACYNKVRSRYKVWPSAYASGALVQCRKKGAANWGNKSKNESAINEFSPAGGGIPPRGPRTPGRDPWGGDDSGEDPYGRPEPKHYGRSIDYFGRFEADHFDDEVFDKNTGVFRGYWDDEEGRVQIAYFKFDNPAKTGSDDPGMGWYYEPQNESVAKGQLDEKCWDSHRQVGMKNKGGKMVPNCVPKESVQEAMDLNALRDVAKNMKPSDALPTKTSGHDQPDPNKKQPKKGALDLATLRAAAKTARAASDVAEATGDQKFDAMMSKVTGTEHADQLIKKLGQLGNMIVKNPKLWARYSDAIDRNDIDWIISLIQNQLGATREEIYYLADLFGEIGGGLGRLTDFAWAVKEGTWIRDFLKPWAAYKASVKENIDHNNPWGDQERFAGDVKVDVGRVSMKPLSAGDMVKYFDELARVDALSTDKKVARITLKNRPITKNVKASDLTKIGQGIAEATKSAIFIGIAKSRR
jgi:hypothetical protein